MAEKTMTIDELCVLLKERQNVEEIYRILEQYSDWIDILTTPPPDDAEYCEHCGNRTSGRFHDDLECAVLMDAERDAERNTSVDRFRRKLTKAEPNSVLGHWRKQMGIKLIQLENLQKILSDERSRVLEESDDKG